MQVLVQCEGWGIQALEQHAGESVEVLCLLKIVCRCPLVMGFYLHPVYGAPHLEPLKHSPSTGGRRGRG